MLFKDVSNLIPKDAIVIEVAPYGVLQAILRESLASSATIIALTQRAQEDNVEVLLQGLGKMYNVGLQPQLGMRYHHSIFISQGST